MDDKKTKRKKIETLLCAAINQQWSDMCTVHSMLQYVQKIYKVAPNLTASNYLFFFSFVGFDSFRPYEIPTDLHTIFRLNSVSP